jgi:alkylhydroperoxidase family enzyme
MGLYDALMGKLGGTAKTTEREASALEFAVRLATAHTAIDAAFMAGLRRHFTDPEIVELGLVTGAFIMLGRLHRAFGIAPMSAEAARVLAGATDQAPAASAAVREGH